VLEYFTSREFRKSRSPALPVEVKRLLKRRPRVAGEHGLRDFGYLFLAVITEAAQDVQAAAAAWVGVVAW
jgi:hypothetical protein